MHLVNQTTCILTKAGMFTRETRMAATKTNQTNRVNNRNHRNSPQPVNNRSLHNSPQPAVNSRNHRNSPQRVNNLPEASSLPRISSNAPNSNSWTGPIRTAARVLKTITGRSSTVSKTEAEAAADPAEEADPAVGAEVAVAGEDN